MLHENLTCASIRTSVFHSLRMQLLAVLTCGVMLPTLLVMEIPSPAAVNQLGKLISLAGASFSAIALIFILHRFSVYPSTPIIRSILPILASLYSGFVVTLTIFRLDYSNRILFSCFFATLLVRFVIGAMNMGGGRIVYWIVPGGKIEALGDLQNIQTLRVQDPLPPEKFTGIYVADLHFSHEPAWEKFLAEAAIAGQPVYHYKQVWEASTGRVQIQHLSENSFGALIPSHAYQKMKRLVDLVACLIALPFTLPLFVAIAIVIRLDSRGPIFFRQLRLGFRGKTFRVLKFRTMTCIEDGNDRDASLTQSEDQRITRMGRILRKSRLDELPQLFNILLGQMSWIGPRPETISLAAWYEEEIPFYRYRYIVRPGITGWAQVNQGHVSSIAEVDAKLQYDFYYIKHLSYWLDILIALRTIRVVLTGFGAK